MYAAAPKITGVAVYLAFVTGLAALCVSLCSQVAVQALVLAVPYVASEGQRRVTLVERRRLEAGTVMARAPEIADASIIPEAPELSAPILAAQMDVAESGTAAEPVPQRRRVASRTRTVQPARLAAADIFGRSFGVMLSATQ